MAVIESVHICVQICTAFKNSCEISAPPMYTHIHAHIHEIAKFSRRCRNKNKTKQLYESYGRGETQADCADGARIIHHRRMLTHTSWSCYYHHQLHTNVGVYKDTNILYFTILPNMQLTWFLRIFVFRFAVVFLSIPVLLL